MKDREWQDQGAIAQSILQKVKKRGAEECSVRVGCSLGHSLQWRNGQLEELSREQGRDISLTVYRRRRKGSVHFADLGAASLEAALDAALAAVTYTEADEFAGLADPDDLTMVDEAQRQALDLLHLPLPDVQTLSDLAARAERAAYASDARIVNSDGVRAYALENRFCYAASNGFSAGGHTSRCGLDISVLAKSKSSRQNQYVYDSRRHIDDLRAPENIAEEAAEKAVAALDPRAIASGSYPVLFTARTAASLIGHLLQALGGKAQFRRLSFLTASLGREVLPPWLSLIEEPLLARGASSALFDSEGIAVREPVIVAQGKVHRYLLDSYAARRLRMAPTGNGDGVHNLKLDAAGDHVLPFAQLRETMRRGVILTNLMGHGVNELTGDYSRGASGFWVENGKIAHPVEGITIAGNLREMLSAIVAICDDDDDRGRIHTPSILIEKMAVAADER